MYIYFIFSSFLFLSFFLLFLFFFKILINIPYNLLLQFSHRDINHVL